MTGNSVIKRTKQDKLKALAGKLALQIAKEQKDPLYAKYEKMRSLYLKYKNQIIEKYSAKAMAAARKAANK